MPSQSMSLFSYEKKSYGWHRRLTEIFFRYVRVSVWRQIFCHYWEAYCLISSSGKPKMRATVGTSIPWRIIPIIAFARSFFEHSIIYGICNVQFHNIPLFISIVMILHCKNTRFVALMQQITCFATLICNFLTLTRMPQRHHVPQIIVVFISIDIISRIRYICEILNFSK